VQTPEINSLLLPAPGAPIRSFLDWETRSISALAMDSENESIWRVWQANEGICITAKEKRFASFEKAYTTFNSRGLEVATRRSGGTTVPHGEGIMAITHIAKSTGPKNINQSYIQFCEKIQLSLTHLGFNTEIGPANGAYCDGDYNVLLDGLKLAGTSQRWTQSPSTNSSAPMRKKTQIVLNHAVMLVSCDSADATHRVNQFHQLADNQAPFDAHASTSLWESKQNKSELSKPEFMRHIFKQFRQAD